MSHAPLRINPQDPASLPTPPLAPTLEEWARLTPAEQERLAERLLRETNAVLDEEALRCGEGDAHQDAWSQAKEKLRSYFGGGRRRSIYIGTNMTVIYPGKPGFSPDLFAVLAVEPHPRDSWLVHREGKGIDLAMEFCKEGDRHKDFVANVERYAALGIQEYFAVDLKRGFIRAWRLPAAAARAYKPMLAQAGRFRSEVLDLELGFIDGTLQFFTDNAVLQDRQQLVRLLEQQVDAERSRAEEERDRAEEERTRAEEERGRAEEERSRACAALREAILLVLKLRGLPVSEEQQRRIGEVGEVAQLQRWLARAAEGTDAATILADS